jgi:hypothetical protein
MSSKNANRFLTAGVLGSALLLGACGDDGNGGPTTDTGTDTGIDTTTDTAGDTTTGPCDNPPATLAVTADITSDTTWCAATAITLEELVFVSGGATLTIEAGTTIEGEEGSALVVSSDGMIDAQGTDTAPIVFTSSFGSEGEAGDWGGLVLLGSASINSGSSNIEGMEASSLSQYGGTDDTHDCGTLRYVRIEYAGSVFGEDNELNGLTVGGCGSDTTLEYIQVHKGLDDGIEFFGGTANIKYAVVTQTGDDSVDWDEGWRGNAQFLVAQQSAIAGDRGFESDNSGDNEDATPRSNPTVYNVTLASAGDDASQTGMTLRVGTAGEIGNVIMMGFKGGPIDIGGAVTAGLWGTDLVLSHFMFFENGDWKDETGEDDNDGGFDEATEIAAIDGYSTEDPQLPAPYDLAAPNFVPAAGSPAADGMDTPGGFFDAAAYYGAFEPGGDNWMAGWTAFP